MGNKSIKSNYKNREYNSSSNRMPIKAR